jgi:hypothetical protein
VVALTLPGVALLHEGQADGRRVRVPVTLGRRPAEPLDAALHGWYDRLLLALGDGLRRGTWAPVAVSGWPDNPSAERLVAWRWDGADGGGGRHVVVVNLSGERADGMVRLEGVAPGPLEFTDLLTDSVYERDGAGVAADGLYVALDGWDRHLLRW